MDMNTPTLTSSEEARAPWNQKDEYISFTFKVEFTKTNDEDVYEEDVTLDVLKDSYLTGINGDITNELKSRHSDFEELVSINNLSDLIYL